jgi:hypothetical protein
MTGYTRLSTVSTRASLSLFIRLEFLSHPNARITQCRLSTTNLPSTATTREGASVAARVAGHPDLYCLSGS